MQRVTGNSWVRIHREILFRRRAEVRDSPTRHSVADVFFVVVRRPDCVREHIFRERSAKLPFPKFNSRVTLYFQPFDMKRRNFALIFDEELLPRHSMLSRFFFLSTFRMISSVECLSANRRLGISREALVDVRALGIDTLQK